MHPIWAQFILIDFATVELAFYWANFRLSFDGDRLYSVQIYLNDLGESAGGSIVFEQLNIGVRPKTGRAAIWTNKNPDGSNHYEAMHASLPLVDAEKWVAQLWFRPYKMFNARHQLPSLQSRPGTALAGDETLPAGVNANAQTAADIQ